MKSRGKRTYRRRRPIRRKRRQRKRNNPSSVIVRGPYICPDRYFCKLVYNDTLIVNPGVSVYSYLFRGNSLYDPDAVVTPGTQPLGFDQLTNLYQRYTVMGAKFSVTALPTSTTGNADQQLTILANHSTVPFTDQDLISQQPYAKTRFIGNGNTGPVTLSAYYSSAKILGVSKRRILDDDIYSAIYNTNPSTQWYIHVFQSDLSGDNTLGTIKIKITYYCKLYDRFPLGFS